MAMPYAVLMPAFAADVFGRHRAYLRHFDRLRRVRRDYRDALPGFAPQHQRPRYRSSVFAAMTCGVALMLFSQSRNIWLSQLLMILSASASSATPLRSTPFCRLVVDDDKRGRVMSFYTMCFVGTAPLGNLALGHLAQFIGTPTRSFWRGVVVYRRRHLS